MQYEVSLASAEHEEPRRNSRIMQMTEKGCQYNLGQMTHIYIYRVKISSWRGCCRRIEIYGR